MKKFLTITRIVIMIAFALAILGVADTCVWLYLTGIAGIYSGPTFTWSGIILFGLTVWFILTIIFDNKFNNFLLRTSHAITSIWIGFFVYFFCSSILYGIFQEDFGIGIKLLIPSVLLGLCGLLNARIIRVTRIEVSLPDLPSVWKGRKVVFVSDLHLGHILKKKFAEKVVRVINSLNSDIVLIGGDLYDGSKVDEAGIIEPLSRMKPKLGTYFATGNHEEFQDSTHFLNAIRSRGIHVLENQMVDIEGLQIIGMNDKDSVEEHAFKETLSKISFDKNKPSLLLKHEPTTLKVAEEAGISMQLSGHTHKAQQWPLSFVTRLIYKQYQYGLHPYGKMMVNTSSGVGTWGPPMRLGSKSEVVEITFK